MTLTAKDCSVFEGRRVTHHPPVGVLFVGSVAVAAVAFGAPKHFDRVGMVDIAHIGMTLKTLVGASRLWTRRDVRPA